MRVLALSLALPSWNRNPGYRVLTPWFWSVCYEQPGLAERLGVTITSSEQIIFLNGGMGGMQVGEVYYLWGWVGDSHLFIYGSKIHKKPGSRPREGPT